MRVLCMPHRLLLMPLHLLTRLWINKICMDEKQTTILLVTLSVVLISVYFVFSLYVYPQFYLMTTQTLQALPMITSVTASHNENLLLGDSFNLTVTSANLGDTADIQITSVSFPNLTTNIDSNNDDIVMIVGHNFTQTPMFISVRDEIGSEYSGLSKTISAKYPSIEFHNRPWVSKTFYEAQLDVTPPSPGNFVVYVKTVALPHIDKVSYYPIAGIRDQQSEFVSAYYVNVTE